MSEHTTSETPADTAGETRTGTGTGTGTGTITGPGTSLGGARHAVSVGHLVMGVAFLGLAVVWGLVVGGVVEGSDINFLLPAPWILAGVAGLVALVSSDRRALAAGRQHGGSGTLEP